MLGLGVLSLSPPIAVPQDSKFGSECGIFAKYHSGPAKWTISRILRLSEARITVVQLECSEGLLIAAYRIPLAIFRV